MPSHCNLCKKSENPCVDEEKNHQMVLTLADITRVPSWHVRKILSCVCSRCILLIGNLKESSDLLRLRCTSAVKDSNAKNDFSLTIETSINHNSNMPQCLTPPSDNASNNPNNNTNNLENSNIRNESPRNTFLTPPTECTTPPQERTTPPESQTFIPKNQNLNSLLQIQYEKDVSPIATESGGIHYESSNFDWPLWIPKTQMHHECPYCKRSFLRRVDLLRHRRSCHLIYMRKCKSMISQRRKSNYQDDVNSITLEENEENFVIEFPSQPRPKIQCPHCPQSFETMAKLKQHSSVNHEKEYKCDICGEINKSQYLHDFHRTECQSQLEAHREMKASKPSRCKTRSQSLYLAANPLLRKKIVEIEKENISELEILKIKGKLICPQCKKKYKRKDHYKKHREKCSQTDKGNSTDKGKENHLNKIKEKQNHLNKNQLMVNSLNKNSETENQKPSSIQCMICPNVYQTKYQLYAHLRHHPKNFLCNICNFGFRTQREVENHQNDKNCIDKKKPARRITRSHTQYFEHNEIFQDITENEENQDPNVNEKGIKSLRENRNEETNKLNSFKLQNQEIFQIDSEGKYAKENKEQSQEENEVEDSEENEEEDPEYIDNIVTEPKLTRNPIISMKANQNKIHNKINFIKSKNKILLESEIQKEYEIEDAMENSEENAEDSLEFYSEEDTDNDDNISLADSLHSIRMSFTNRWLNKCPREIIRRKSIFQEHLNLNKEMEWKFKAIKELEKLHHEVRSQKISCPERNCNYISRNLNLMMYHDYIEHFKKPRYFCNKCGDCFTSRVYLDYHLDIQDNGNIYHCHKCEMKFLKCQQLQKHLLKHLQQIENYKCFQCNLEFLDYETLKQHCRIVDHNSSYKRKLIEIEYAMESNAKQIKSKNKNCNENNVYYIPMRTLPLPRQNIPLSNQWYNRKLRIGRVEFENAFEANCVGIQE